MDFRKYLRASVAAGALLAFSAPVSAVAGAVNATNSKIALTIGGRVHKSLTHADDGVRDALFFTDGLDANTEMWWAGSAKLTETVTMGAIALVPPQVQRLMSRRLKPANILMYTLSTPRWAP